MATYTKRFKRDTILASIEGSGGVISVVARRLGVDWHTAKAYIGRWASTQKLFDEETEKTLDAAEMVLFSRIRNGDTSDARWLLERRGRSRGWGRCFALNGEVRSLNVLEEISEKSE